MNDLREKAAVGVYESITIKIAIVVNVWSSSDFFHSG